MATHLKVNFDGKRWRALASALIISIPILAQQPYTSNDVTPPSSVSGKLNSVSSGKQVGGGSNGHAILENGNALNTVDLHPAGYTSSMAVSNDDVDQCGNGFSPTGGGAHALRWSGSAASVVDMHSSSGATWSYCTGNHQGQYVGYGERPVYVTTYQNGILWTANSTSFLYGPPTAGNYSKALGVRYGQQVGYASTTPYPGGDVIGYHYASHAVMWMGTAASAVDLNPTGYSASEALATNGTQQGGWALTLTPTQSQHAMVWAGTPESAVDLHPDGYSDSKITALSDSLQVGDAWVGPMGAAGSVRHAMVWSGTAASAKDLNQYLPTGYVHAVATGIDADENVVGFAYNTPTSGYAIPADAIAVVFAPGQNGSAAVNSLTVSNASPAPGKVITGTVGLAGPAPSGGVTITFAVFDPTLLSAPAPVTIPAGQTSATFSAVVGGAALQVPTLVKLYATDGTTSRAANLIVTPVVNISSVTANPVEGGFLTTGTLTLTVPAQAGGALVTLASSNPALASLPATVALAPGQTNFQFNITTTAVTTSTVVPISASYNGLTVPGSLTLSPAPVVAVASVILPANVVGGQTFTGTVNVTNYPRNAEGVVVTLASGDSRTLQVPATVTIPQGAFSASFTGNTIVVTGTKGVAVKATIGASNITSNIAVLPIPTITIVQAVYYTDTHLFKVAATALVTNAVYTYGTDPLSPPLGTLQFELGQWGGGTVLATAPAFATVWSSDGGQATAPVTQKLSTAGGGGGGGGGGSTTTFKLTTSKNGKGTITVNPNAATFASGTVVTLTATPDPGSPWIGWSGACSGTATTCTLTVTSDKSVTANFR